MNCLPSLSSFARLAGAASLLSLTVAACATTKSEPIAYSCGTFGLTALPAEQRPVSLAGISVTPPAGPGWCLVEQTEKELVIASHPWLGQTVTPTGPGLNPSGNTFLATATVVELRPAEALRADADLPGLVEEWIANGFGIQRTTGARCIELNPPADYQVINFRTEDVGHAHPPCVGFAYVIEDRSNPRVEDSTITLSDVGRVCRHPWRSGSLATVTFGERIVDGQQIDAAEFGRLRSVGGEPFFNSIRFRP